MTGEHLHVRPQRDSGIRHVENGVLSALPEAERTMPMGELAGWTNGLAFPRRGPHNSPRSSPDPRLVKSGVGFPRLWQMVICVGDSRPGPRLSVRDRLMPSDRD